MLPTICENFKLIALKLRPERSKIRKIASKLRPKMVQNAEEFFRILDQLGLNFEATNLKFSQIVGNIVVYNL